MHTAMKNVSPIVIALIPVYQNVRRKRLSTISVTVATQMNAGFFCLQLQASFQLESLMGSLSMKYTDLIRDKHTLNNKDLYPLHPA